MIDVKKRTCKCGKKPVFGLTTDKIANYCKNCKLDGMINIVAKKCKCGKKQPRYAYLGKKAMYCKNCKKDGMIDVSVKRCACGTRCIFGFLGDKFPTCCKKCKKDGMVDITSRINCKCDRKVRPIFGYPGEKAICCKDCKTENMIDIISKRCPNCKDWVDFQLGNKKYDYYCSRCFQQLFPDDPRTLQIRKKSKEILVRDFLNINYNFFINDKSVYIGCDCPSRKRLDFYTVINNTILVIEVDENQHKYYPKDYEELRYNDLYMTFSGKWIFIRYNPDSFLDSNGKKRNPILKTRLKVLKQEIDTQINRIKNETNKELLEIIYLYYNKI